MVRPAVNNALDSTTAINGVDSNPSIVIDLHCLFASPFSIGSIVSFPYPPATTLVSSRPENNADTHAGVFHA